MAKKTKTGIVFQVWGRDRNENTRNVRRVCSVGKTEKEGVVVKGKEVEEVESEE